MDFVPSSSCTNEVNLPEHAIEVLIFFVLLVSASKSFIIRVGIILRSSSVKPNSSEILLIVIKGSIVFIITAMSCFSSCFMDFFIESPAVISIINIAAKFPETER